MNSSQNYEIVKSAITNKTSIKAMYHGKLRFLSPHTLGHTDGHEQALFYQFDGESNSIFRHTGMQGLHCPSRGSSSLLPER